MHNLPETNEFASARDFNGLDEVTGLTQEIVDSEHPLIAEVLQSQKAEDSVEDLNICFTRADNLIETAGIELTPNPESDVEEMLLAVARSNTDISTEGFGSDIVTLAKTFWTGMFEKLNSSWDNILEYMIASESKIVYLESRVGEAIRSIEERESASPAISVMELHKPAEFLNWRGRIPLPTELIALINKIQVDASVILVERTALNIEYLHRILKSLESILESRDIERVRNDLRNVAKFGYEIQRQTTSLRSRMSSKPFGQERNGDRDAWLLGDYVGNRKLIMFNNPISEADINGDGRTLLNLITQIFSSDILIEKDTPGHIENRVRVLTLKEAHALLEAAERLLAEVTRFNQRFHDEVSGLRVDFRRLRHDLSIAGASTDLKEFNLYMRKAAYAAQRSTQWMFNPYVPMTTFIIHLAQSALIYAEQSIRAYPVKQ